MSVAENLQKVKDRLPKQVELIAVSKTKPIELIEEAYAAGHRHFGENRVAELVEKQAQLPGDIRWHMIGHLQSKKVKHIVEFVHLIHGVDSFKLLETINRRAEMVDRKVNVLLQMHIAQEESKYGFDAAELEDLFKQPLSEQFPFVSVQGFMGMATFTENKEQIKNEFQVLAATFKQYQNQIEGNTLSMGMSGDYPIAIECGSNMLRIGSAIFGSRN